MIFKLMKADTVTLGIDSFIVKVNQKSGKKESHNKKENETTLTELLKLEKLNNTQTDKSQKKNQMKSKKINRIHYPIQQSKIDTDKKSTKIYEKISTIDRKNEKKSLFDLVKNYVDRNWKKALAMISLYIILLGSIIGTPILVHHFRANHQNQVDQFKEGFIVNYTLQFIISFSL